MNREKRGPAGDRRDGARPAWPILALVALLAGIFAVSCGASSGAGSGASPSGEARQAKQPPEGSSSAGKLGNPTLGAADAPVVMVEWGDFQ